MYAGGIAGGASQKMILVSLWGEVGKGKPHEQGISMAVLTRCTAFPCECASLQCVRYALVRVCEGEVPQNSP